MSSEEGRSQKADETNKSPSATEESSIDPKPSCSKSPTRTNTELKRHAKAGSSGSQPEKKKKAADMTYTIAFTSEVVFDIEEEEPVDIFQAGRAMQFVKNLGKINDEVARLFPGDDVPFRMVLIANSSIPAVKLINSTKHYHLNIEMLYITENVSGYLKPTKVDLYVTHDARYIDSIKGVPIALVFNPVAVKKGKDIEILKIVFDADGVIIDNEIEKLFKKHGLRYVIEHEEEFQDVPLKEGPLKALLEHLTRLKRKFGIYGYECPIKTIILSARNLQCAGRVLKTLEKWNIDVDEKFFMAGTPKYRILRKINPVLFLDDTYANVSLANDHGITSAQVFYAP